MKIINCDSSTNKLTDSEGKKWFLLLGRIFLFPQHVSEWILTSFLSTWKNSTEFSIFSLSLLHYLIWSSNYPQSWYWYLCCLSHRPTTAWLLGLQVWIQLRDGMFISFGVMCCVGSGLCDGLITRSEESYQMCVKLCMV